MVYRMDRIQNRASTRALFDADNFGSSVFMYGGVMPTRTERALGYVAKGLGAAVLAATLAGHAACGGGGNNDNGGGGNRSPVIGSFSSNPANVTRGQQNNFQWAGVTDPDGDMVTCKIDVNNDGAFEYTINNCPASSSQAHTYTATGSFTARLTVDDGKGGAATATTPVGVNAPASADIQGTLIDALTGACSTATQSIPIKLIYKSDNNKVFNANTDTTCKYKFTVNLVNPPGNDQFNISITRGAQGSGNPLYGYSEDFSTTQNLTKDLYDFEIFIDPLNSTSTDPRKDLLQFMLYMTATDGSVNKIPTGTITYLRTWRHQDRPLQVQKINAPTSPVDYSSITDTAISQLNADLNNILKTVTTTPTAGTTMTWSPTYSLEGRGIPGQVGRDANGNALYPITWAIEIREDSPANTQRKIIVTKHELLRFILGNSTSSPFINHIMYDGVTQDISDFEKRFFKIMLNLPDNHDMSRQN